MTGGGRGSGSHLHAKERDGVWEVQAEEVQDLVRCSDLLKLVKGHEESAGESFVLWKGKKRHADTLKTDNSLFPSLVSKSLHAIWGQYACQL